MDYVKILFCIAVSLFLFGCSDSSTTSSTSLTPKTLRVSVLPDQNTTELQARYGPLLEHLEKETGIHFQLELVENYQKLLDGFHQKSFDIVRFGGLTYLNAHINDNAQALVMRDVDTKFISYYLVSANSTADSIQDFKDKPFSFGSKLSTSGHLMPRHFLSEQNITPETYFSEVLFSGAHDTTVNWVKQGKVPLGVVNGDVVNRMYKTGAINKQQVRILSQTPPYADYVWTHQPDIPEDTAQAILDAFLKLSFDNPNHKKILETLGAKAYLPAVESEFFALKDIATKQGLLKAKQK